MDYVWEIHPKDMVMLSVLRLSSAVLALLPLLFLPPAHAEQVAYDFAGGSAVGGIPRTFTGSFVFDNSAVGSTVYFPGETAPVQQGFSTVYAGSALSLALTLDNGETVSGDVGSITFSNIQQAESGAQLPEGLSLQAYMSNPVGTINGINIQGLYLAFTPVTSNYSWDALDTYFSGNAEQLLQNNPGLLPTDIDPTLTGTALPADIQSVFPFTLNESSFSTSQFIGTVHSAPNGVVTTVNYVSSFGLAAPVPETGSALMMLAGLGAIATLRVRRHRG